MGSAWGVTPLLLKILFFFEHQTGKRNLSGLFSYSIYVKVDVTPRDGRVAVSHRPVPFRPAPSTGRCRNLAGRGGDGVLRDIAVSPPIDNIGFFNIFFLNVCFSIWKFYLYIQGGL